MSAPIAGQVVLDGIPLLVEPNTYSKGEDPLYGRAPLRLDSPINLSPISTWVQSSYIGGMGQEKWSDTEMYYLGDADTRFGYIQCKYKMNVSPGTPIANDRQKIVAIRPRSETDAPRLYYAAHDGNFVYRKLNVTDEGVVAWDNPSTVRAMGRSFTDSQYGLAFGLSNGQLWMMPYNSEVPDQHNDVGEAISFIDSLAGRGDIAGDLTGKLHKRTGSTWTRFGTVDMPVYDGEPWNQRLWIIGHDQINRSALYVTDTVTTQEVYRWSSNFVANRIVLHAGQLYILGYTNDEDFTVKIGQLWSYNGASMRMIFQVPDELWKPSGFTRWDFWAATSYRKWLAFGMPQKGVWFYDPEQDAIHPVVNVQGDPGNGNFLSNLVDFNGRLVAFLWNTQHSHHDPGASRVLQSSYLVTSEYDAGLPGQDKVWLRARVRLKEPLPSGSSVQVYYTTQHIEDDSASNPAWVSLGSVSTTGTKTVLNFPGPTNQPISHVIRLRIVLNPVGSSAGNDGPRIEDVELDYMVVPDVKWSWSFQAIGAEGVVRPDGQAYEYPDAASVQAALEAARRNSAKKWVTFEDKDGQTYNVQIVSLTTYYRAIDASNLDGETAIFNLTVAEV